MQQTKKKSVTVRLPIDILRSVSVESARRDITRSEFVERALRSALARAAVKAKVVK